MEASRSGKDGEDRELVELQKDNLRIQNEHLQAQAEFYQEQNEIARMRKRTMKMRHEDAEKSLEEGRLHQAQIQRNCTHRKGGKGDDLVNNVGSDPNFSIIKHQYPWGEWSVLCTRCFADWRPGDTPESHPSGIGFEEAFKWNTDNSSSGSAQFLLPPDRVQEIRQAHRTAITPQAGKKRAEARL
jgi:hypothetical protein